MRPVRPALSLALFASLAISAHGQGTKSPDDRIHLDHIAGGTALIRDVAGDYAQHPKVFRQMMAIRDRLFTGVGACFGIYPNDPDAVESPVALRWQIGVRVAPRASTAKLAVPPKPYRLSTIPETDAAVIETTVQTAGSDGLAMFRWMAEHGYVQTAPTRVEYLSHEGDPMLLPVKIIVPVRKRRSGLILAPR